LKDPQSIGEDNNKPRPLESGKELKAVNSSYFSIDPRKYLESGKELKVLYMDRSIPKRIISWNPERN